MLYQKIRDSLLSISRPFRTICKQSVPTIITTPIILWLLPAQDTPNDINNAKQMANKTDIYWKTDLDAAYLQIHANDTTLVACIAILYKLAFLWLLLSFGTTPAPAEYMTVSKAAINPGNDLIRGNSLETYNLNPPHRTLLPKEDKQKL